MVKIIYEIKIITMIYIIYTIYMVYMVSTVEMLVTVWQGARVGSVAKFDFWAKSKNRVSGIQ